MSTLRVTETTFDAYRLDPGGHHEDGTPALLYEVASAVSRTDAYAAAEADQIIAWVADADGNDGHWDYQEDRRQYAVVPLDDDGDPVWPDDNAKPDERADDAPEWDDICRAAGISRYVVALGEEDDVRDRLAKLWAAGTCVVAYYDDTSTETTEAQDEAAIATLLKRTLADGVLRVDCDEVSAVTFPDVGVSANGTTPTQGA